jgi:hypothetical protein
MMAVEVIVSSLSLQNLIHCDYRQTDAFDLGLSKEVEILNHSQALNDILQLHMTFSS